MALTQCNASMALTQCNASTFSFPLDNKSVFSAPVSPGDESSSSPSSSEPASPTPPSISPCVSASPPPTDERDKPSSAPATPGDMRREDDRLATFAAWPVHFMRPAALAEAGFYYLGRDDEVRCAFCKIEIGRWEEGDDPASDHERWAPQCPLLRRRPTGNVPRVTTPTVGHDVCGSRAVPAPTATSGPKHPRYAPEEARLRSYKDWPRSMRQKPEDLADAGFFYTGQGDKTVCFYCGVGLKDWEDDDRPWEQHARWFKRCAYVQLVKGRDYVQTVATEKTAVTSIEKTSVSSAATTEASAPTTSDLAVALALAPSPPATADDAKLCKICFAAEHNVCFVPCGHVVACAKCALATDKCPLCRQTFQNAVRLYYS